LSEVKKISPLDRLNDRGNDPTRKDVNPSKPAMVKTTKNDIFWIGQLRFELIKYVDNELGKAIISQSTGVAVYTKARGKVKPIYGV
jgi:hypothetical protein